MATSGMKGPVWSRSEQDLLRFKAKEKKEGLRLHRRPDEAAVSGCGVIPQLCSLTPCFPSAEQRCRKPSQVLQGSASCVPAVVPPRASPGFHNRLQFYIVIFSDSYRN